MPVLLAIESSPHGDPSVSRQLTAIVHRYMEGAARWRACAGAQSDKGNTIDLGKVTLPQVVEQFEPAVSQAAQS